MLHDFYHFLPSPSVLVRMGVPSAIRCTYNVCRQVAFEVRVCHANFYLAVRFV
jgi:hypothetical protein